MGLVQLPLLLVVGDTMGGSSAYCTVVANGMGVTGISKNSLYEYFDKFRHGIGNWWQVGNHTCIGTCTGVPTLHLS